MTEREKQIQIEINKLLVEASETLTPSSVTALLMNVIKTCATVQELTEAKRAKKEEI